MKFAVSLLASIVLCLPGAALANDEEPLVFAPTSQWNVDYGAESCELRRLFSDGTRQLILKIPGTTVSGKRWISILVEGLKTRGPATGKSVVEFLPTVGEMEKRPHYTLETEVDYWGIYTPAEIYERAESEELSLFSIANDDSQGRDSFFQALEEERATREKEVTGLLVEEAFKEDLLIETGSMNAAMTVLRDCIKSLPAAWGVEEEAAYPPKPVDQYSWTRRVVEGYPSEALRNGEIGNLPVVLVIGTNGRVEKCIVPSSPASQTLKDATCNILKRYAKFEPARNEAGDAIRSLWRTSVIYQI